MKELSSSHVQKHPQEGNNLCTAPPPEEDGGKNAPTQQLQLQCSGVFAQQTQIFPRKRESESVNCRMMNEEEVGPWGGRRTWRPTATGHTLGYGWAWAGTSHISTCMDERAELKMSEQDGVISLHLLWL